MLDLIIKNATIVTMNDDDEIIYDGSIGVKDKNIVIVFDQIDQAAGEVIDAKGKIALPGLFNGHTHSYNYIAKGLWDGYALDEPRAYQDLFDHQFDLKLKELCLKITCAESIKNGITFLFDNGMEGLEPQSLRIMDEIGVKGLITDWDLYEACKNTDDIKRVALALWHEGEEEFESNYDGMVYVENDKKKADIFWTFHCLESIPRREKCLRRLGKSPIQWFYEKGFLNERMILSHCVHLDEKDIELIADAKAGVVNTPFSEMRLADGIAPIPEMLQKGILVSLGTDGGSLNTAGDIFYEMKQICLLHSVSSGNPKAITPLQALKMATVFPARMFKQNSGMIAIGKAADIILLDQNNFAMLPVIKRPFNNIISSIVYSGSGSQVTDTIIDGRIVMRDRKLITVNEEKIIAELNEAVEEITSKYDAN